MISTNFIKGMGITFFIIGVLGAMAIFFSFDFDAYDVAKGAFSDEVRQQANTDLITMIIYMVLTFAGSWFLGTLLMAIERIIIGIEGKEVKSE